jgi:formate-dependent nitrite reductase membrane component NrfD
LNNVKHITKIVSLVNIVTGIILGTYTGILLSTLGARPLWNSDILWILFLISGLSSAAAIVHMIAKERVERELLARADNLFLFMELLVLALFFIGLLSSTEVQIRSAMLLLNGPYAAVFWVFVVLLGIVVPLFIQVLAVNQKIKHTPVSPIMVIIGGLVLRFIIVSAGQFSHYANAHFIK